MSHEERLTELYDALNTDCVLVKCRFWIALYLYYRILKLKKLSEVLEFRRIICVKSFRRAKCRTNLKQGMKINSTKLLEGTF
jgi:hypothetical protein